MLLFYSFYFFRIFFEFFLPISGSGFSDVSTTGPIDGSFGNSNFFAIIEDQSRFECEHSCRNLKNENRNNFSNSTLDFFDCSTSSINNNNFNNCYVTQCIKGCQLLSQATLDSTSSCQTACQSGSSSAIFAKTPKIQHQSGSGSAIYCTIGCNDVIARYWHAICQRMTATALSNQTAAPSLAGTSPGATDVKLKWQRPPEISNLRHFINCHVQFNLTGVDDDTNNNDNTRWQYCQNVTWNPMTEEFHIRNLTPYSKYHFRVVLNLGDNHLFRQRRGYVDNNNVINVDNNNNNNNKDEDDAILHSAPSVAIVTLPQGAPTSTPRDLEAVILDYTSVNVSWQQGAYPNGPLLSYVLEIFDIDIYLFNNMSSSASSSSSSSNKQPTEIKDLNATTRSYLVKNLTPQHRYNVSVQMRNAQGAGPKKTVLVTTPTPPPLVTDHNSKPMLILGTQYDIYEMESALGDSLMLYTTTDGARIEGLGIHIGRQLMFLSDSAGALWQLALNISTNGRKKTEIRMGNVKLRDFRPLDLTVDWLNDLLYMVASDSTQNYVIQRMRLFPQKEGVVSMTTVVYAMLPMRPVAMEIDPCNGYLFWSTSGEGAEGEILRLDISDVNGGGNGVSHGSRPPEVMLQSGSGGGGGVFVVDYLNFRLFVHARGGNTGGNDGVIKEVGFNKKIRIIRNSTNVAHPVLGRIVSMSTVNNKFYWTNGSTVFSEEFHQGQNRYYHNAISHSGRGRSKTSSSSYQKLFINSASRQPWPRPLNPPTQLQAIFNLHSVTVKWQPPHLLGLQSKAAYQKWHYRVEMTVLSHTSSSNRSIDRATSQNASKSVVQMFNSPSTDLKLVNLTEATQYRFRVQAYSPQEGAAHGTWSSPFEGATLSQQKCHSIVCQANSVKNNNTTPTIIWSSLTEGVQKSDISIDSFDVLLHKSRMPGVTFTAMTSYDDLLFLVTNSSHVKWLNCTSRKYGSFLMTTTVDDSVIDSVGSLTCDWLGRKLYWSNLKQQLIIRGNFDGTEQEPLPILTLAKELRVDALNGFLYWSREYDVECARLNGANPVVYEHLEPFSGKQVTSLTLDFDHAAIYWVVRSLEESQLFSAQMQTDFNPVATPLKRKIATLDFVTSSQGLLSYFSNRFFWLLNDSSAIISDLHGRNVATMRSKSMHRLNYMYLMSTTSQLDRNVNVRPYAIDSMSIRTVGTYDQFNVTWASVKNVNFGTVFYEVQFNDNATIVTRATSVKYSTSVKPYELVTVTVRAYTYWASAHAVRVAVRTPEAAPSRPRNLRHYVTGDAIQLRWAKPESINGILTGYTVKCWNDTTTLCQNDSLPASAQEFILTRNDSLKQLSFSVQAKNRVGCGEAAQKFDVNVDEEAPPPRLLISTADGAISLLDADLNVTLDTVVEARVTKPIELVYDSTDGGAIYWLNSAHDLFLTDFNDRKTRKLQIDRSPRHLSIDWLANCLLFTTVNHENMTEIRLLDLNQYLLILGASKNIRSNAIYRTTNAIRRIDIDPFTQLVYWLESNDVLYVIKLYDISKIEIKHDHCASFSFDAVAGAILGVTKLTGDIFICQTNKACAPSGQKSSLLAEKVTGTVNQFYWTEEGGALYNSDAQLLRNQVDALCAYAQQPQPEVGCQIAHFDSQLTAAKPKIERKTANSIELSMPQVTYDSCALPHVSKPSILYKILYKQLPNKHREGENKQLPNNNLLLQETEMRTLLTLNRTNVILNGLKPYTTYEITVILNKNDSSQAVKVRTAPGAPTPPRNVTAQVLLPTKVAVRWRAPAQLNSDRALYEVHWLTEGAASGGIRQKGELNVRDGATCTETLELLRPGERYTIWIRAYSSSDGSATNGEIMNFSDSARVEITTYPEPDDLQLVESRPNSIRMRWRRKSTQIERYELQYAPMLIWPNSRWLNDSINLTLLVDSSSSLTNDSSMVQFDVTALKAKTQYKFRLLLFYYPNYAYIWPPDGRFTFETLGDRPSTPAAPGIQIIATKLFKVVWEQPADNGAAVTQYALESLAFRRYRSKRNALTNREGALQNLNNQSDVKKDVKNRSKRATNHSLDLLQSRPAFFESAPSVVEAQDPKWRQVYNGSENFWLISDNLISDQYVYSFRVSAENRHGWSDWSSESAPPFDLAEALRQGEKNSINLMYIAILIPLTIGSTLVFCFAYMACSRCWQHRQKSDKLEIVPLRTSRAPLQQRRLDLELATLRELPRHGVHSTNLMYVSDSGAAAAAAAAVNDIDQMAAMLPHIRRDQISLTRFLGSGAFGEVFQGQARIGSGAEDTEVAVKTLRKSASEQEKTEFLQEAHLMSHFKHEHIVRMLCVCLDNDPQFIIMELMEGGDLLTYLRTTCRNSAPSLRMRDLLKMCLDLAKGCRYLEEMHFVHRDLACRNCLVSFDGVSGVTVVKIGDFGLARDIYKNDYYRKEGGLLPVRWMAPESLLDNVFSSKSDVWSFGVTLWEILTLGQQPYQARSNMEVLDYVKNGGRLGKPNDCPMELYDLILTCWDLEPDQRPSFKFCLQIIDDLHVKFISDITSNTQNTTISSGNTDNTTKTHYISTVPDDNSNYDLAEVESTEMTVLPSSSECRISSEKKLPPVYLELLYEKSSTENGQSAISLSTNRGGECVENDGYLVPNELLLIKSKKQNRFNHSDNDENEVQL